MFIVNMATYNGEKNDKKKKKKTNEMLNCAKHFILLGVLLIFIFS